MIALVEQAHDQDYIYVSKVIIQVQMLLQLCLIQLLTQMVNSD